VSLAAVFDTSLARWTQVNPAGKINYNVFGDFNTNCAVRTPCSCGQFQMRRELEIDGVTVYHDAPDKWYVVGRGRVSLLTDFDTLHSAGRTTTASISTFRWIPSTSSAATRRS
jgi:hypothetical protein